MREEAAAVQEHRGIGETGMESCQSQNLAASGKDVIPLKPLCWLRRALSHATGCLSRLPHITGTVGMRK